MLQTKWVWITLLIILMVGCVAVAGVGVWQVVQLSQEQTLLSVNPPAPNESLTVTPTSTLIPPTPLPAVTPTSSPIVNSPPEETDNNAAGHASPLQLSTEEILRQAVLPERDQRLLAMRLSQQEVEIPEVVQDTPPNLQLGDMDTFWVTDNQQPTPRQLQVTAVLKYITDHSYWWVQEGFHINEEGLKKSAERFEQNTYPTNRAFFGSEWSPGVDNDVHVHVFMGDVPGVAGYFSASNEYSQLAEPYSNEREMFFLNLSALQPGNDYFNSVLAHEFQHMIHWYQDKNEDTWINEGLSELAAFLNGYGSSTFVGVYAANPDTQLTGWSSGNANYGGGFLFMAYFLQRYGEAMTQAVVAHPLNGTAGIDAVLADNEYIERFDDIFADFLVANYVQDSTIDPGTWGYTDFTPNQVNTTAQYLVFPQQVQETVHQYGADYIELISPGSVTIEFTGTTQVKVIDNNAHSGAYQWYSHRGDDTNTRLTHPFDLSDVSSATLNYWTWYDIEEDWDFAYVEVSTDGGKTWTILQTPHSITENHTGNAYGPGYSGASNGWLEENIDLSGYAGQKILIRFEYVTDDAVNHPGWAIDDISIPEIDFYDDVESGPGQWQADGFVRIDNTLPQKFLAQVIEIGDEVTVEKIALDENNHGALTLYEMGDTVDRAILVISGLTPVTTEIANYEYKLKALE